MPQPAKLRVVKEREGNPGKRPIKPGVRLPPGAPTEPDWRQSFQVVKGPRARVNARCRRVASETWREMVAALDPVGVLSAADRLALADICRLAARMDEGERQLSAEGLTCLTERGITKNPVATELNAWRTAYWSALRDYGLTALSRDRLNPRTAGDDDDADFDRPADPSQGHR
jgi:P27 family predicted phage terminase small subunit